MKTVTQTEQNKLYSNTTTIKLFQSIFQSIQLLHKVQCVTIGPIGKRKRKFIGTFQVIQSHKKVLLFANIKF